MAKTMKKVMHSVLADALESNSAKAKRKAKKQERLMNVVQNNTLEGADNARIRAEDRWIIQRKAMRKAGITKSDAEWKQARKANKKAGKIWLKHMGNIAEK